MENCEAKSREAAGRCSWVFAMETRLKSLSYLLLCYRNSLRIAMTEKCWISLNGSISMDVLDAGSVTVLKGSGQETCVTALHPIRRRCGLFFSTFNIFWWASCLGGSCCELSDFLFCSGNIYITPMFNTIFYPSLIYGRPIKRSQPSDQSPLSGCTQDSLLHVTASGNHLVCIQGSL